MKIGFMDGITVLLLAAGDESGTGNHTRRRNDAGS
jgi:hypothetical protein